VRERKQPRGIGGCVAHLGFSWGRVIGCERKKPRGIEGCVAHLGFSWVESMTGCEREHQEGSGGALHTLVSLGESNWVRERKEREREREKHTRRDRGGCTPWFLLGDGFSWESMRLGRYKRERERVLRLAPKYSGVLRLAPEYSGCETDTRV